MYKERVPVFIDPTTDFGFKRIFGTETDKDLLIDLLNELFRGRKEIKDLYYNKNEHVGDGEEIGSVIFDLTCTASNGEQFIIEVQRTPQVNLKKRMLYYGSKLVADQAPKGDRRGWNYAISEVYVIVLLDGFAMLESREAGRYLHDICLCNRFSGENFYQEFGFIYIELINFTKGEEELYSDLDKWLYVLKNLSDMDKLPTYMRKPIFEKLFAIAAYSKLNKEERTMYDVSLKRKWDAQSIRETAIILEERAEQRGLERGMKKGMEEGLEKGLEEGLKKGIAEGRSKGLVEGRSKGLAEGRSEGIAEGIAEERAKAEAEKIEAALRLKKAGVSIQDIATALKLSEEELERLT